MVQTHIVVGAGIIGAATAFQLCKAGQRVIVISAGQADATSAAFGWINASFFINEDHHVLRVAGLAAWRRAMSDLPLSVDWQGCLCWDLPDAQMHKTYARLRAFNYPVELYDAAQIAALVPALRNGPGRALFFPREGAASSAEIAGQFLAAAQDMGARLIRNIRVTGIRMQAGRAVGVETTQGLIKADHVVIAAGTGTAAIAESIECHVPLVPRPAYILRTTPHAHLLQHILATPGGEIRQEPSGQFLLPVAVAHQADQSEVLAQDPVAAAEGALARLQTHFAGLDDLAWAEIIRAERPVPADDLPIVGSVADGVYVAVMHSGITLGPIMGELISKDIGGRLSNADQALLAPYRPDRF
ncbi:FAD-dependent oxidoreductase [Yoonia sp. SS1-5]|uniref:NAD(P)/FAD-dependent oxidoreductase n=1 Tax=Yoonia rhodophyticola TaxID=3137370 RepID=A0AAN0MGI0_9RHOB